MNDDELLAKLKAADPASSPDAPKPDIKRLLEATMSTDTQTRPEPMTRKPRGRWLSAVAAGVLLVTGSAAWSISRHDDQTSTATPPVAAAPSVARLSIGGASAGMCFPVGVADLRRMETAFEGEVTSIRDGLITLQVAHWYRGGQTATVEVRSDSNAVTSLLGVDFQVGSSYLVSAVQGQVSVCGESAPAGPELRKLYEQAFSS